MIELEWYLFQNLRLAKQVHDAGYGERLMEEYGEIEVNSEDSYFLADVAAGCIFEQTMTYFNEEKEISAFVMFDPVIDELTELCRLYEKKRKMRPEGDMILSSVRQEVWSSFQMDAYDYAVWLYCDSVEHGRGRLVLLYGYEFCGELDVPEALICAKDAIRDGCERFRRGLGLPMKEPTQLEMPEKEAA